MSEHIVSKSKTVKIPGPGHPISVECNASRVVVAVAGRIVANTREALTLREASYPPVQYIPRKDVDMTLLARTDHATYCPCADGSRSRQAALRRHWQAATGITPTFSFLIHNAELVIVSERC
jgi:Domain of unknown function (DUF427)